VQLAPDHPDAWYFLGDAYFHVGTYLGYADRMERATAAFRRALALDSTFAGPLSHMVDLAVEARDTAEARRVGRLFLGTDGGAGGGYALVVRWRLAHLLGDAALREETWTSWDTVSGRAPFLPLLAQSDGAPAGEVDRLFRIMSLRASSQAERVGYYTARAIYLLELGRPRDALAALDSLEQVSGDPAGRAILDVLHALYVDGDTTAAVRAAARLAPLADGALADSAARRAVQYDATCAREQWRVANGRYDSAPRAVARLRGAGHPRDLHLTVRKAHLCALLIDAMAAVGQGRPDAVRLVERADSVMRQGPLLGDNLSYQNLAVGRLFAAVGEYERALAAVRRGGYFGATAGTYHREEGRLAEQTGDREGAVRAWARYLRHRSDPEPELRPAVEAIRARLAELAAEPPR
jgi:tetratricopeptide (TPR) repeat protein